MTLDRIRHARVPLSKRRSCLCCSGTFESGWAGERICPRCKTSATWRDDLSQSGSNHARYQGDAKRKRAP